MPLLLVIIAALAITFSASASANEPDRALAPIDARVDGSHDQAPRVAKKNEKKGKGRQARHAR
jgi:hypothetical protein